VDRAAVEVGLHEEHARTVSDAETGRRQVFDAAAGGGCRGACALATACAAAGFADFALGGWRPRTLAICLRKGEVVRGRIELPT
jgi:hypothetical protein